MANRDLHRSLLRLSMATAAVLLLVLPGCNKGTSVGSARGGKGGASKSESDTLSAKQILQKGGLCDEDREVTEAPEGTDDWVILRLYQLALGPSSEEAFESFRALFPESRNTRQIKEMYWPRIRKNVHKYMIEPGEAGFVICRTIATDRGRKYYIKSTDPRQHPPPIEIGDSDGSKKVLAFTPF